MEIIEKILKTQDLATLPTVATKILQLIEDENINLKMVGKLVESDPALSVKILRVANSTLFATRSEVSDVTHAVMNLGFNRLSNIVLSISIFSKFLIHKNQKIMEYIDRFWWHSTCVAVVSKSFVNRLQLNFKEKEFLAGMLHDIGKLVLMQVEPEKYAKIIAKQESSNDYMDVTLEKAVFGFTHLDVGLVIAQKWKLPSDMIDVIRFHNTPEKSPKQQNLVAAIRCADLLCEMWGASFFEGISQLSMKNEPAWLLLKSGYPELDKIDIEKVTFELEQEFKRSSEFLSILKSN